MLYIIDESVIPASVHENTIALDSPNYIGIVILDFAKSLMHKYFYTLKDYYGDKMRMYIDTDKII